jgi:hypothetical protein
MPRGCHPFPGGKTGELGFVALLTYIATAMGVIGAAVALAAVELVTLDAAVVMELGLQGLAELHRLSGLGNGQA